MSDKNIKAIIMAGGEGSRLRPITDTIPKPLAPLGSETALSTVLKMLSLSGIKDAAITLKYKGEMIEEKYGTSAYGVNLTYMYEKDALGTAGGVKAAEKYILDGNTDTFAVASGDAVCDFDLRPAIKYHREKGARATIILTRVPNPLEYGVVFGDFTDGKGEIKQFAEKPPVSKAYTNLVNTGIYILSAEAFGDIPFGQKYDFGRDLFPTLIGRGLYGYEAEGYWCDIGDANAYKRCVFDAARGKIKTADNCKFAENFCVISDNCRIPENTKISGSIFHKFITVGEKCKITGSIICEKAIIEDNCRIEDNCVIGAGSIIGEGSKISGVEIAANSIIPANSVLEKKSVDIISFSRGKVHGLAGEGFKLLGYAINEVIGKDKRVGVMWQGSCSENVFGLLSTLGEKGCVLGCGYPDMAAFAARRFDFELVVLVKCDNITFYGGDGCLVSHEIEREIIKNFGKTPKEVPTVKCNYFDYGSTILSEYFYSLQDCTNNPNSLSGLKISVSENASAHPVSHMLRRFGAKPRGEKEDGYHIETDDDGNLVSISEITGDEVHTVGASHIAALLLLEYTEAGDEVELPCNAPRMLDFVVRSVGGKVKRNAENKSSKPKGKSHIKMWLYDGGAAALMFLSMQNKNKTHIKDDIKKLPEFVFVRKKAHIKTSDGVSLMCNLYSSDEYKDCEANDGIRIDFPTGSLCVIPEDMSEVTLYCDAEEADEAENMIAEFADKLGLI